MSTYFTIPANGTIQDFYFEVTPNGLLSVTDLVTSTTTVMPADVIGVQNGQLTHTMGSLYAYSSQYSRVFTLDGKEVMVMATMYNLLTNSATINTPPAPMLIIGVNGASLTNRTAELFPQTYLSHWTRDIHVGDIDGNGGLDIFVSNQGR